MPGLGGREAHLERLGTERFDVLVIGGGITGAGVALDAAARGLSVALVEQQDFAGGTSSRSTKLVHGGLRYLPMLDIVQVREDLQERGLLLRNAPYLVRPLPFVLPLYAEARRPLGLRLPAALRPLLPVGLACGLWAYDVLAGLSADRRVPRRRAASAPSAAALRATGGVRPRATEPAAPRLRMRPHRRLTPGAAAALVPPLRHTGLRQAYLYYDAVTDDARLVMTVLRTAARRGAAVVNYARVTDLVTASGRVTGARVRDLLSGRDLTVSAGTTVNATGVWAESVAGLAGRPTFHVRRAKGVHLVVSRRAVRLGRAALVLPETDDGRLAFVVPWQGAALIGTTDTEAAGPPDAPRADPGDVAYLLDHASRFLDVRLGRGDVLSVYAGVRALVTVGHGAPGSSARLSRRHEVAPSAEGFVTVVGGKLTTYRRMAEDVVNHVTGRPRGAPSPTRALLLEGAEGLAGALPALRACARSLGVSRRTLVHLVWSYGTGAAAILDLVAGCPDLGAPLAEGQPHIGAEVVAAARDEMAVTVADVLVRRTRLAHLLPDQGREIAPRAAALMADQLGWSVERRVDEVNRYVAAAAAFAPPRP
jgi:glycerol-3-phosphate dehydrogenase